MPDIERLCALSLLNCGCLDAVQVEDCSTNESMWEAPTRLRKHT